MTYQKVIDELKAGGEIRYMITDGRAKYYMHQKLGKPFKLNNRIMGLIIKHNFAKCVILGNVGITEFGKVYIRPYKTE
jgi:hypothetical protein